MNQLLTLTINGNGIVNDSSNLPRLNVEGFVPAAGAVLLADVSFSSGTAGNAAITTNSSGGTVFANASTAGNATITTNSDGITEFRDTSTGGSARFITNAGGILDVSQLTSGGMTVGSIEGAGTYFLGSKTLTVGLNNLSTVVSGTIADGGIAGGVGGMLIKEGTGTLTLTGPNTYSGGTALNAGILAVNGDGNLGTGALSFNGGALEALSGITSAKTISIAGGGAVFLADGGTSSILSGSISGVGSFAKIGHGTLTLTGSNTYSGGTALDNGALIVAATNALGTGPVTVNDPTLLQIEPSVSITNAIAINNGGTLINGGTIQVSAAAGGPAAAVTTSSGATITNESGGMITGFGLIAIQSTSGTATITNSGVIEGTEGVALANGGTITNNAGATISGSNGTAIASSGGSTNLSNAGVINGNVTLGNGANTVQLFSGSRISGDLNLGASAGSNLILDGSRDQRYSQAVTGATISAGSLTKQGSGNWTVDVALNAPVSTKILAGVLTVNSSLNSPVVTVETGGMLKGIGVVNGNLLNGGSVSPGNSPGTLNVNGNFTQGSSGIYNVEIVSPQSYSRLLVTGRANLDGTLQLTLASGFRPSPGQRFVVLSAGQGISGTFRSVIDPGGPPVQAAYQNGAVEVSAGSTPKAAPVFLPSDGTPAGTTALVSDYVFFNSLGSLAGRIAATSDKSIGITFDGGKFDFEDQHGQTYGFPIAGHLKLTDRVALDYEIPLQYVELPGSSFLEAGAILNFPIKMLIASGTQPWSWNVTPTAAIASTGSKEIMGAGALTNVVSFRWHGITTTYGNYISFFEGETLVSNDPAFPKGTSQQIMKNGLKVDIPFGKGWTLETYGIYTQFFQSAQVSSYYTIGAEVGRHIIWRLEGQPVDLGYYSVGLYVEQGNHYNSGDFQFGSGWKF